MNKVSEVLSIWTQNLWLGGDIRPGLRARSLEELRQCVDRAYQQINDNDFPSRAKRLVKKIAECRPQAVALQEVARVSSAKHLPIDYLEMLEQALDDQGLRYKVASLSTNGRLSFPSGSYGEVTLVDRDVILINDHLELSGRGEYHFNTQRPIRVGGEDGFAIDTNRGFAWANLEFGGNHFRLFNAHLELNSEETREQAYEVFLEIGASQLPVIVTGDFNADPSLWHEDMNRYMVDLWLNLHATPGDTFADGDYRVRCDVTLYDRDFFEPMQMKLTGPGDWMSDHAGLLSIIGIRKTPGKFGDY